MNDLTVIGNLLEAVLWAVFSIVFGVLAFRSSGRRRRLWVILAVAFFAFGVSDVIESRTGAWWRPPALFVLKASCVAVFLYGVFEYRTISRTEPDAPPNSRPPQQLPMSPEVQPSDSQRTPSSGGYG